MARLALRVPWGVVVAVLFISCTPATDEPSPTATPTATAAAAATAMPAATATPIVTPTPVPPPVTSDTWPELSLDATISPSCRAQIIAYAEFSGTLAEIAQQEAALVTVLGHQFSRLTDGQLGDIDSRIERLDYDLDYQASWGLWRLPHADSTPHANAVAPRGDSYTNRHASRRHACRRLQVRTGPRGSESVQSSTRSEPNGPVPPRRARRLLALCGLSR